MPILTKTRVVLLATAVLGLFPFGPAEAQQRSEALQQAIALVVEEGEWEQGVVALQQLLDAGELSQSNRSEARKFLAVAYMQLGREERAVEAFKAIVRNDPQFDMNALSLDGAEPPAKMVRLFGQAILEVRREEVWAREAELRRTSRAAAFFRSAALPGWGQRYQGYTKRGYIMAGLTVVSVTYAVLADRAYRNARDAYNTAPPDFSQAEFDKLYDDYAKEADRADLALGIVGAVWILNMIDAAIQGPNIPEAQRGLTLRAPHPHGGVQVAYYARF